MNRQPRPCPPSAPTAFLALLLSAAAPAAAADVLVFSSGSAPVDQAVLSTLEAAGHTVTLGPTYDLFDGTGLTGHQVVYFQANANWSSGDMPAAGQTALLAWVNAGHGLVTSEWTAWKAAASNQFHIISACFAAAPTVSYSGASSVTFVQAAADAVINAGLPVSFNLPLDSYSGTFTPFVARAGATTFYNCEDHAGLVGWSYGGGRVADFITCTGPTQLANPNGGRLLSNAITWAAQGGGPSCLPEMNGDGVLNIQDFLTFLQFFASADSRADFDHNGSVNLQDFLGYLQAFAQGC